MFSLTLLNCRGRGHGGGGFPRRHHSRKIKEERIMQKDNSLFKGAFAQANICWLVWIGFFFSDYKGSRVFILPFHETRSNIYPDDKTQHWCLASLFSLSSLFVSHGRESAFLRQMSPECLDRRQKFGGDSERDYKHRSVCVHQCVRRLIHSLSVSFTVKERRHNKQRRMSSVYCHVEERSTEMCIQCRWL